MPLLWLDTNATRRKTADLDLLAELARRKQVPLVVHPQVYLERRRQMQVDTGPRFSASLFDGFLERNGISVFDLHLTRSLASTWADTLFQRYPTHARWEAAKKATLGGQLKQEFSVEPGRMPMTTDWLIALEIEQAPESFVITADQGEEWQALRTSQPKRAFSWTEAIDWLEHLPT